MLNRIIFLSRGLNRWVEFLVSGMGITMAGIVGAQVFFRYGLNHSLFWSEEAARILLVWLTFLGATVAYYHQAHPGVDGLFRRLGPKGQKTAALISHLAALILFSVMVGYGIKFAYFVRLQITPALAWPKWTVMGAVPVSGIIFWIHGLKFISGTLAGPGRNGEGA